MTRSLLYLCILFFCFGCSNSAIKIHPELTGEIGVWKKSDTKTFTWVVITEDDLGNRTKIEVTERPEQSSKLFKVTRACLRSTHMQVLTIRSLDRIGSRIGCTIKAGEAPSRFFRHDMQRILYSVPKPPPEIAETVFQMKQDLILEPNEIEPA